MKATGALHLKSSNLFPGVRTGVFYISPGNREVEFAIDTVFPAAVVYVSMTMERLLSSTSDLITDVLLDLAGHLRFPDDKKCPICLIAARLQY